MPLDTHIFTGLQLAYGRINPRTDVWHIMAIEQMTRCGLFIDERDEGECEDMGSPRLPPQSQLCKRCVRATKSDILNAPKGDVTCTPYTP